jgi:hypothetical protein
VAAAIDPEPVEQGAGLVLPEGEIDCPDLGQHTGQAQPMQRPRRVPAGGGDDPQAGRGAVDQSQEALVHDGPGDLMQIVENQDDRRPVHRGATCPGAISRVIGDGVAQAARSGVPDRGHKRLRDGRPEGVQVVLARAQRDPHGRALHTAGAQPGTGEQRLAPARGGGDQHARGRKTFPQSGVQARSNHHIGGERDGEPVVHQPRAPGC